MTDGSLLKVIEVKPIGTGLDTFRDSFSSVCQDLGIPRHLDSLNRIDGEGLQNLALTLVSALQTLLASRLLESPSGGRNLFGDLLRLPTVIGSDSSDVKRAVPLLRSVLNNDSGELVWKEVYEIVAWSSCS